MNTALAIIDSAQPAVVTSGVKDAVTAQLDKILKHKLFSDTTRMKRFLAYVVEQKLSGHGNRLKGYSIGLEVFDRPDSFDPQADTIVRVQAGQLRRRLDLYYSSDGKFDEVRILIPKGSYVPHFQLRKNVTRNGINHETWQDEIAPKASSTNSTDVVRAIDPQIGPGIIVTTLETIGDSPEDEVLAHGLTAEITNALTQFRYLRTISRTSLISDVPDENSESIDLKALGRDFNAGFILSGSLRRAGDLVRVTITLIETETGKHVFSNRYDRHYDVESLFDIQEEVASYVAAEVGAPYGVVNRITWARGSDETPTLDAYEALLEYFAFMRSPTPEKWLSAHTTLKRIVSTSPRYSLAWAAFSLLESYQASQSIGLKDRAEILNGAVKAAKRAVAIDSRNALAYEALFVGHFHTGNIADYEKAADIAIALNPNDDRMIAFFAVTQACLGDFEAGISYMNKANSRNLSPPIWYSAPIAIQMISEGQYNEFMDVLGASTHTPFVWSYAFAKASLGHLGKTSVLKSLTDETPELLPDHTAQYIELGETWNFNKALKAILLEGWHKADALMLS